MGKTYSTVHPNFVEATVGRHSTGYLLAGRARQLSTSRKGGTRHANHQPWECRPCYQRKYRRIKRVAEWVLQWRSFYEAGKIGDTITGPGAETVTLADLLAELREWDLVK